MDELLAGNAGNFNLVKPGSVKTRTFGHMLNTLKLLRLPFSLLLMPVFLFALGQSHSVDIQHLVWAFVIMHILVYPASNGYNSYNDRDTTSIGGLEHPPQVTKALYYTTLIMDLAALACAFIFVNLLFFACVLVYIAASRLYSYRGVRLKQYPYLGFMVVFIFQGGFTYFMSLAGINDEVPGLSRSLIIPALASSFQIGAVYPLTQIYQHEADLKDGVTTLSYRLGYKGTFAFSAANFIIANLFYFLHFKDIAFDHFMILQLFFIPTLLYFGYWFMLVQRHHSQANFKHTMRLNLISAICMNCCFIFLIYYQWATSST